MEKSLNLRILEGAFLSELHFQTSRSGGPGGQHVNKVETKVQLNFDVDKSGILTLEEKELIRKKLAHRLTAEGVLQVQVQEKRSQLQNKELAVQKFHELLRIVFKKEKVRKPTKPGKAAVEKRLKAKKAKSEKKSNRGWRKGL